MRRKLRSFVRQVLRSRLPLLVFLANSCAAVVILFIFGEGLLFLTASLAGLITAVALGYSTRMRAEFPRLREFRRSDYAAVWNALSTAHPQASIAAAGTAEIETLNAAAKDIAQRIALHAPFSRDSDVLEIGCGVGRIGWALAPLCRSWIGCDISSNMLRHAQKHLCNFGNVHFVHLSGDGLKEVESSSVDLVYCTNVLPHLIEADRWLYMKEAHRVLRPGGRIYIDTILLDSQEGWAMLENNLNQRRVGLEPPYAPTPSAPEEFLAYFKRADFADSRIDCAGSLLIVVGTKTSGPPPNQVLSDRFSESSRTK